MSDETNAIEAIRSKGYARAVPSKLGTEESEQYTSPLGRSLKLAPSPAVKLPDTDVPSQSLRPIGQEQNERSDAENTPVDIVQKEIDPEDNYINELCATHCVLRDVVGCDNCGIFHYAYKRKEFKIKVTKNS